MVVETVTDLVAMEAVMADKTSDLIRKSQAKRGAPGTLKRKVKGKMTLAKARALKNRPGATTLDKKQANFFINMHSDMSEKNNPRIPRKKGQPAGSDKHSDLYTDENPKGTIKGLKFTTVDDAKASVNKIKNSGRSHAHKIQAAVAMEQRARVAGKTGAAAVYRKFINAMKEKTKQRNESLWRNIHNKRKRGEKMRKKGEKGAPTPDQIKRAQGEMKELSLPLIKKPAGKKTSPISSFQALQRAMQDKRNTNKKEDTTTASIPNPALTSMGPSKFLDRRSKKKLKPLKMFRDYYAEKGIG